MKTKTTIRERTAIRAYYAFQNGSTIGATADWLAAEVIELAYAERRAATAQKAAATRRANNAGKVSAAVLVTARKPAPRRPTAH